MFLAACMIQFSEKAGQLIKLASGRQIVEIISCLPMFFTEDAFIIDEHAWLWCSPDFLEARRSLARERL